MTGSLLERSADYAEALDRIAGDDDATRAERRYGLRMDDEIESLPPIAWLADGILPANSLAALYGAPGSGKSFVALDLACSITTGVGWMGRTTGRGRSLYLAAEGLAGLPQRLRAWKRAHGYTDRRLGVGFVTTAVDLMRPETAVRVVETAAQLQQARGGGGAVQLVVIDTLARSMIGDENATLDMSRVVAHADAIRTGSGAAVLLVHHTRKESDLERGSSALRGAVDTLLLCREGDDGRELVCEKQKDAENFATIPFRLVAGHGSCIVQASVGADPGSASEQAGGMTPKRCAVLRTLCDAFTPRGATTTEWMKASAVPERTFFNVRTWLVREGYVIETGSRYTVSPSGRYARTANCQSTANGTAKASEPPSPLKGGGGSGEENGRVNGSRPGSNRLGMDDGEWGDLLAEADERFGMSQ